MSVRGRHYAALVAVLSLFGGALAAADEPLNAGTIKFPRAFRFAGNTLEEGKYQVRVESAPDGPTIVLSRDGTDVVRELAVTQGAKGGRAGISASITVRTRDDGRLRLRIAHSGLNYLAFFESAK